MLSVQWYYSATGSLILVSACYSLLVCNRACLSFITSIRAAVKCGGLDTCLESTKRKQLRPKTLICEFLKGCFGLNL